MHEGTMLGHRDGVVSAEHWAAWENVIRLDLADPVCRAAWPVARAMYARAFVEYIDAALARQLQSAPAATAPGGSKR
jgi:hypothetical protein